MSCRPFREWMGGNRLERRPREAERIHSTVSELGCRCNYAEYAFQLDSNECFRGLSDSLVRTSVLMTAPFRPLFSVHLRQTELL
jgi:hypothetical protein